MGCPTCKEEYTDNLLINDDDNIHCLICGTVYRLGETGIEVIERPEGFQP
jgi:uncharacterized Zn finger protein